MESNVTFDRSHYISESRKWLTALNELRAENILLKEQLSEAVQREVSPRFVEQADLFQQSFIEKDQIMDLLRYDINNLLYRLPDRNMNSADERQCIVLEKDMRQLVLEFGQMKTSFAGFLLPGAAQVPGSGQEPPAF